MKRSPYASSLLRLLALFSLLVVACGPRTAAPGGGSGPTGRQAQVQDPAEFYRGKTVTVIVGYAPGGGYDTVARLVAKYLGGHMPGQPNVIVENMDGAGSLIAANHLFSVARPDGLTIGLFNEQQILNQATGVEGVQFDGRRFGWIGSALKNTPLCSIRSDSPYRTGNDLLRHDLPPLVLGGTGPGANTDDFPKLLTAMYGTNIKLVSGYRGTADIRLATETREVDGLCWSLEALEVGAPSWLETQFVIVPIYQASQADPALEARFPTARRAEDLAKSDDERQLIRAANAPGEVSRPFVAPPGVPAERLQALRAAFKATLEDPAFLADAQQARMTIAPTFGEDTARIVNQVLDLAPEQAKRLAEIRK
jgi:tripartite-type tricarboxylate transporter receptor subunit TctC